MRETDSTYLSQFLASKLSVRLCPLDLPRISLHFEVLVAFAAAEIENLQ